MPNIWLECFLENQSASTETSNLLEEAEDYDFENIGFLSIPRDEAVFEEFILGWDWSFWMNNESLGGFVLSQLTADIVRVFIELFEGDGLWKWIIVMKGRDELSGFVDKIRNNTVQVSNWTFLPLFFFKILFHLNFRVYTVGWSLHPDSLYSWFMFGLSILQSGCLVRSVPITLRKNNNNNKNDWLNDLKNDWFFTLIDWHNQHAAFLATFYKQ